jgi:hypothetical protein
MAWLREEVPSLRYLEIAWVFTVLWEMYSRWAISGKVRWVASSGSRRRTRVVRSD